VAGGVPIAFAAPMFEDNELFTLLLTHDLDRDRSGREVRLSYAHRIAVSDHEYVLDLDRIALLCIELLNLEYITGSNLILLASRFNDRVHA
jgi:hypothetical protein